jgi:hypothetical protein
MSFERYIPMSSGRTGLGKSISLSEVQINFGSKKPPHEYVAIEYDVGRVAIRFGEGNPNNGYMVKKNTKNYYYISCSNFLKRGYLPKGRYSPVDNKPWTFVRDPKSALDWRDL